MYKYIYNRIITSIRLALTSATPWKHFSSAPVFACLRKQWCFSKKSFVCVSCGFVFSRSKSIYGHGVRNEANHTLNFSRKKPPLHNPFYTTTHQFVLQTKAFSCILSFSWLYCFISFVITENFFCFIVIFVHFMVHFWPLYATLIFHTYFSQIRTL